MSDLPRYTAVPNNEEEIEPLTKGARDSFESQPQVSSPRTGYPPNNAEASSSGVPEQHVTYVFEPRFPDQDQRVLGVMGRNREVRIAALAVQHYLYLADLFLLQETIAIVREAFKDLAKYPNDRITFHASLGEREAPMRIMDAVWRSLANKPPSSISVRIEDTPEDAKSSESIFSRLMFRRLISVQDEMQLYQACCVWLLWSPCSS